MARKDKKTEIRFTGFTGAWEQRKVVDVAPLQRGFDLPKSKMKEGDYPVVMSNGVNGYHSEFKAKAPGVVTGRSGTIGNLHYIESNYWPHNTALWVTDFKENEPLYIYYMYQKLDLNHFGTGSGVPTLNRNDVHATKIYIPNRKEQRKIAEFFQSLDNLITLHQRKYDKLAIVKKSMLEKMFPKDGANVPEIRFAGFTDVWEQHKFEDNIVSIQTGTNLLGAEVNIGIPLLKMGNIQRGVFSLNKLEYLAAKEQVEKENIVQYGDFLFNTRNTLELVGKGATWTGKSGEYAFNSNIARFVFNGLDTIFFNYLYNTQDMINQVHARAVGTTSVAAVYPKSLNSLEYMLPKIEEQKKIGELLLNIDNLIILHQRELGKLKNIKESMLEKMFV